VKKAIGNQYDFFIRKGGVMAEKLTYQNMENLLMGFISKLERQIRGIRQQAHDFIAGKVDSQTVIAMARTFEKEIEEVNTGAIYKLICKKWLCLGENGPV
jgi:hypothetical protein